MSSPINLPAIFIANVMGLAILFVIAVGNKWRLKDASKENTYLSIMFFASVVNCIVDPLCFYADGKPGLFNRILVIGCNTLLYLGGAVTAYSWIFLVSTHLQTKLHTLHRRIVTIALALTIVLLITNLFTPVLFETDANNVYSRLGGYWIHTFFYGAFMVDGLVLYLRQRHTSGGLKFFPVWAFIIPAGLGISIQALFYGISTAAPFTTVSMVCVMLCLQNEFLVRDKLTGCYNRFYLTFVEDKLLRNTKLHYSAIMLDINGFKKINDTYGHKVGDEALIRLASLLSEVVDERGEVIRYAGDEFIIILNTQNDARTEDTISRIHDSLEHFNASKSAPYSLSVATGHCKLILDENTMDDFMDQIDKRMYVSKQEYYNTHKEFDRRSL